MLIDFHTHAFPDKLALRAIETLAQKASIPYFTNGTVGDTNEKMNKWNVDARVMLSIATNPKQQTNVNNFAIETNNNKTVFAFGSVYPLSSDAEDELCRIKNAGLLGVKFHPEYQQFDINDKSVYHLYEKCIKLGLIVVFHAGKDLAYPNSLRAAPEMIKDLASDFGGAPFVMAHFGSCMMPKKSLLHVAGCGFYVDTSFSSGHISADDAKNIIKKQGADKVLFGSDCPWASSKETFDFINSLDISNEDKEKIFYKNALGLLQK